MSADNQQERPDVWLGYYIAGFVDGEGSFHVAVQKSKNVKLGIQVIPEFHVSQNANRTVVLEIIKKILGCGYIKPNHRTRFNDRSNVLVVRNHNDLAQKVIPFFMVQESIKHFPIPLRRSPKVIAKGDFLEKYSIIEK